MSLTILPEDHFQGSLKAPVQLMEYADYQCPYCGQAYYVIKDIQKRLGDKLVFIFRNFPIPELHPYAISAAIAAEVAAEQGKFWEMHDIIFKNQKHLQDDFLFDYARQIGLDMPRFETGIKDKRYFEKVRKDFDSGVKNGVQGTPAFFVNGRFYSGNWMEPEFVDFLESQVG